MSLIKVWPYVIITVLVVPVISWKKVDPMEQIQNISRRAVQVPKALPQEELSLTAAEQPFFAGGKAPTNIPDITKETVIYLHKKETGNAKVKQICFVSVFDESRNIPFYSAYKVTSEQAALIGTIAKSGSKPKWRRPSISQVYQAVNKKRIVNGQPIITRGHLNPAALNSFNAKFRQATFTLTNAAPMFEAMNRGAWEKYEGRIRQYAKCPCGYARKGTLYLLTGTSNYGIQKTIDTEKIVQYKDDNPTFQLQTVTTDSGRVVQFQIPRAIWTAGCCVWKELRKLSGVYGYVTRAESFAVMCNNDPHNVLLAEMSVPEVELLLKDPRYGKVKLFPSLPGCGSPDNTNFRLPL